MPPRPVVLFRVACGPRRGFGHLVRAIRLARALETDVRIAVDGRVPPMSLPRGVSIVTGGRRLLRSLGPRLLVLDTPVAADARRWLAAARRHGVPVASVHDRGIAPVASDLAIDGSVTGPRTIAGASRTLKGPRYMIVDPRVSGRPRARPSRAVSVLIAFGGGARTHLAWRVARAVRHALPEADIRVAGGFAPPPANRDRHDVEWVGPKPSLVPMLASASTAVLAGGVTLYEAAALGVAAVAIPVVPAQAPTVRALARAGVTLETSSAADAADAVARLMAAPDLRRSMGKRGAALVDGRGAGRVARHLRALMKASA
jgi:spore coat polysaccharide biosynthesis predicted glycosyltransferase SpsG